MGKYNFSSWYTARGYGMAGKFSRWFDTERAAQRDTPPRLSALQQTILRWLWHELHRRQRAGDINSVPYPELVRAIAADKASITGEVRRLLHKGLVGMSLPPGKWERFLTLTDKGAAHAKTLSGSSGQPIRRRR